MFGIQLFQKENTTKINFVEHSQHVKKQTDIMNQHGMDDIIDSKSTKIRENKTHQKM